ncbi:MAG: sigma-70 family RNA polymerase sigma factor [Planctomycetes bacterium]|nr:sigma-70 family RNA polymerase sigma factor [Planctomycetota bacterium]
MEAPRENPPPFGTADFPSTRWSLLAPGSQAGADERARAWETLANAYLEPIRAFLRRALRRDANAAEELAQDFYLWMLESDLLAKADRERGSFRAFLKTALRRYVLDADRRARAQKRGGAQRAVPLIGTEDEPLALADPRALEPERALDDAWRAELVTEALAQVEAQLAAAGRSRVFEVFRAYFLDPAPDVDYRGLAERFGLKVTDISNDLVRAKQLFRQALERRVRETVASPLDLRSELAWLLGNGPA